MTNRDFLEQVSTDGLPDAATVLEGAKPRSVWRRVAVAVVAAVAIGAVVTVGAQVHMNELEKIEASTGKESIDNLTRLEPGKLYTIETHYKYSEDNPREAEYSYSVYNELPEGTNLHELPYSIIEPDSFSDDDESRGICFVCHGFVWTPSEPVEYSYQRPSASEPETFHVGTLNCAQCGYQGELFEADGKPIPRGLQDEITRAFHADREVKTPTIEGLTLYDKVEQLDPDVIYRAFIQGGNIFFYESTPENNGKVSSWVSCVTCDFDQRDFYIREKTITYVDEYYGDEYTYDFHVMVCAKCGEESFGISD